MVRYSFLVRLSHPLLHTGLSRRILDDFIRAGSSGDLSILRLITNSSNRIFPHLVDKQQQQINAS